MKPIVRQILNDRAKAKQVDMMLNPPDVIAGGPGSGRRGGGREREGAGSAYDKMHQQKVREKYAITQHGKKVKLNSDDKENIARDREDEQMNKAQEEFDRMSPKKFRSATRQKGVPNWKDKSIKK